MEDFHRLINFFEVSIGCMFNIVLINQLKTFPYNYDFINKCCFFFKSRHASCNPLNCTMVLMI